jgi:hypothetical protein
VKPAQVARHLARRPRCGIVAADPSLWRRELMPEPENLVLALLRDIRRDIVDVHDKMATKEDNAEIRSEMRSLRADVASDFASLDKRVSEQENRLSEQIAGLRRAVMEYHSSAIGHGILISEFEDRLRRIEQHLNLPPIEAH